MWRNSPQSMFQHRDRQLRREHGFTGQWTLTSKDDSNTSLNWTTAYSGGMQNDSGSGTIKGKSSEGSTRRASGTYSSGATSGSYSEDWKSNLNGNHSDGSGPDDEADNSRDGGLARCVFAIFP